MKFCKTLWLITSLLCIVSAVHSAQAEYLSPRDKFLEEHGNAWLSAADYSSDKPDADFEEKTNNGVAIELNYGDLESVFSSGQSLFAVVGLNLTFEKDRLDSTFFEQLLKFPGLQFLLLKCDSVTEIPDAIGRLAALSNLRTLCIRGMHLKHVSKEIYSLSSVEDLEILGAKDPGGVVFEPGIASMPKLETLDVMGSRTPKLPPDLNSTKLRAFTGVLARLGDSVYTALPQSIEYLSLSGNPISRVPSKEEMGRLGHMTDLYLRRCQISSLPADWKWGASLVKVVLDENKISDIPRIVPGVSGNWKLYLHGNPISSVHPDSINWVRNEKIEVDNPSQWGGPWTNSLGMVFVAVEGTSVRFSIWETRVGDYETFVRATNRKWKWPDFPQAWTYPAVKVNWGDAKAFCAWLTEKERAKGELKPGEQYRLPTDAEWSIAVGLKDEKGKTPEDKDGEIEGIYPWGTNWPPPSGAGNFADASATFPSLMPTNATWRIEGYDDGYAETAPVGSFKANKFGLYDMSGNAAEWCEDWYSGKKSYRVMRGGSWISSFNCYLWSSSRSGLPPDLSYDTSGFRVVIVEKQVASQDR